MLHNVPHMPKKHVARPEQLNLRDELLRGRSGGGMLGIVGKARDASALAVGIAGSAGLGKSTAAAWLARDVRVQTAFGDGIFWLTFGQEREAIALLLELARAVGVPRDELADAKHDVNRVSQLIKESLDQRHCLIILDDVWRTQQPEPFRRFAEATTAVLLTTRKRDVTDYFGATLLPLEQLPGEVALELLTNESGKAPEVLRGEASGYELSRLVKLCSGIPAMLRSVGRMCSHRTVHFVLTFLEQHRLEHEVPEEMDAAEGYCNLFLAIEGQLTVLREEKPELERCCVLTAVFEEDDKVPVSILPTLWNVSPARASGIVTRLAKEHLVQLSEDGETMSLLDVHRDYYACRAKSELPGWHSAFLRRSGVREIGIHPRDASGGSSGNGSSNGRVYWHSREGGARFLHHVGNGEHPENLLVDVPSLQTLHLSDDIRIGVEGAKAIGKALEVNGVLTELTLGDEDGIGDEGAKALASALRVNEVLTKLTLDSHPHELDLPKLRGTDSVTSLDLSRMNLGTASAIVIASLIAGNEVLTTLDLYANNIGPEGAAAFSEALKANVVLTELDLSSPNSGGDIGDEGAKALASALRVNEVLKTLDVRGNEISGDAAQTLATAVLASPSLELFGSVPLKELRANTLDKLDLSGKDLRVPEALVLAKLVEGSGVLKTLVLYRNNIRAEGAAAIAEALRGNEVLTNLNLRGNSIGAEGAKAIGEALAVNGVLKNINLLCNNITVEGTAPLVKLFRERRHMESLCGFKPDQTTANLSSMGLVDADAMLVGADLEFNGVLTDLNLGSNQIRDEGAAAIAEALRGNEVLNTLDLYGNNIRAEGAAAIAEALRGNAVLTKLNLDGHALDLPKLRGTDPVTSLDLSGKALGPASAIVIASLIAGNGVLTTLDLSGAKFSRGGIGPEGASAIAEALKVNEVLKSLDICCNKIGPKGAAAIAEALRGNAVLKNLNLYYNNIGDTGAIAIAEALRGNAVLTELDVSWNRIGPTSATAMAEALRGNTVVLTTLDLRANDLGDEGKGVIRDAVSGRVGFELAM